MGWWHDEPDYYPDADSEAEALEAEGQANVRRFFRPQAEVKHNLIVKVKKETPKAVFVVAQNPDKKGEYREYWIPKSQISATKDSTKRAGLKIITVSSWIYEKLQPSSQIIFEDYDYVTKPKAEPGKRQYSLGNKTYTPRAKSVPTEREKDPLDPDDDDRPF